MNFIVAVLLIFFNDVEDAFWSLIAITECYFSLNYFDSSLSGALADQKVCESLLIEQLLYSSILLIVPRLIVMYLYISHLCNYFVTICEI